MRAAPAKLERLAAAHRLAQADAAIEAAVVTAVREWLQAVAYIVIREVMDQQGIVAAANRGRHRRLGRTGKGGIGRPQSTVTPDHLKPSSNPIVVTRAAAERAADAAAAAWNDWRRSVDNNVLPAVAVQFGEAFQQTRLANRDRGTFTPQMEYMQTVADRLRIWPADAFEKIRPELVEALAEAETIEQITDRVGMVLGIDADQRAIKSAINEVEAAIDDPDVNPALKKALRARRRRLWEQHDEEETRWRWLARRIARTECLPADTQISGANVTAVYRRHYEGEWVKVKTRSGREIAGTPNHPVLTLAGWKGLAEVTEADRLVCYTTSVEHAGTPGDEDIQDTPPTIGEIFDAAAAVSVPERERTSKPDFHGDGREGYVDVLRPDGLLKVGQFSALRQGSFDSDLTPADESVVSRMAASRTFSRDLPVAHGVSSLKVADWDARFDQSEVYDPLVHSEGVCDCALRLSGHVPLDDGRIIEFAPMVRGVQGGRLREGATFDAPPSEHAVNGVAMASNLKCDGVGAKPGLIELDDVVVVQLGAFSGHVFNLTCVEGYFAGPRGIVTSNTHGAVQAGQLAAARQNEADTGEKWFKRWLATADERTRVSHRVADGQVVPLSEKFRVGGFLLQFPGDPVVVAPHETINCRCSMLVYGPDALQDALQGPDGSIGEVRPEGVRIGPDDPDEVERVVAEVAAREHRAMPDRPDDRGEFHGQPAPAAPVDVELTDDREAPQLDALPDLSSYSDDELLDLMTANLGSDDGLYEAAQAEYDRRTGFTAGAARRRRELIADGSASGDHDDDAMIALLPSPDDAARLAVDDRHLSETGSKRGQHTDLPLDSGGLGDTGPQT